MADQDKKIVFLSGLQFVDFAFANAYEKLIDVVLRTIVNSYQRRFLIPIWAVSYTHLTLPTTPYV